MMRKKTTYVEWDDFTNYLSQMAEWQFRQECRQSFLQSRSL